MGFEESLKDKVGFEVSLEDFVKKKVKDNQIVEFCKAVFNEIIELKVFLDDLIVKIKDKVNNLENKPLFFGKSKS